MGGSAPGGVNYRRGRGLRQQQQQLHLGAYALQKSQELLRILRLLSKDFYQKSEEQKRP